MSTSIWLKEMINPNFDKLKYGTEIDYHYDCVEDLNKYMLTLYDQLKKDSEYKNFHENELYETTKKLEMISQLKLGIKVKILSEMVTFTDIETGKIEQYWPSNNGITEFYHFLSSDLDSSIDTFDIEQKLLSENIGYSEIYLDRGQIRTIVGFDVKIITLVDYDETIIQTFRKMHDDYGARRLYKKSYIKFGEKTPNYHSDHYGTHDFFNFPPTAIMHVG